MSRIGKLGNACFKKEAVWGTYIAGDIPVRLTSESLLNKIENIEDPSLLGTVFTTEQVKSFELVSGAIESMAHPDTMGVYLHQCLGGESAVSNPALAYVIVSYTGSANYARLTIATSTLTAETSSTGSAWTADTNFNTTGSIDLTASGFDTLTELQAAITGYTGWDAILCGSGAGVSANIAAFSATNLKAAGLKVGEKILSCNISASTTAKTHNLYPAAAADEIPSMSWTINRVLGTNQSLSYTGIKVNSLAITLDAAQLMKVSLNVTGKQEGTGVTDVSLTVPTYKAFIASNAKIIMSDSTGALTEWDEVKNLSLTVNNNIDENRCIGSLYLKEQIRQSGTMELSITANNTSTQYAYRGNYTNSTNVSFWLYVKSDSNADSTNSIPFSMLIRIPDVRFSAFDSTLSTPDRLQIAATGTALKPTNTVYTNHIYAYVIDTDITTY